MAQDSTGQRRRLWTVAAAQGSGGYGWRGGSYAGQWQLWTTAMAVQDGTTAAQDGAAAAQDGMTVARR
jgi:hypothetical protein